MKSQKRPRSRWELFSLCGKLVGHYPVAGWLRVACSYVERLASGTSWDHYIGDDAHRVVQEVLAEVSANDPVLGMWNVWCDSIALGVIIEIAGTTVEDAVWLRKKDKCKKIIKTKCW